MNTTTARTQAGGTLPTREYVTYLAMRLANSSVTESDVDADVQALRARLRSPRHRLADVIADRVQKSSLLWPIVSTLTEAALRWELRRQRRRARRSAPPL
jgi:hypothetical protein